MCMYGASLSLEINKKVIFGQGVLSAFDLNSNEKHSKILNLSLVTLERQSIYIIVITSSHMMMTRMRMTWP